MTEALQVLEQNQDFVMNAYGLSSLMGVLIALAVFDLILKGWGMWRAARMEKKGWFVALLIINSIGILPLIFLILTWKEYVQKSAISQ